VEGNVCKHCGTRREDPEQPSSNQLVEESRVAVAQVAINNRIIVNQVTPVKVKMTIQENVAFLAALITWVLCLGFDIWFCLTYNWAHPEIIATARTVGLIALIYLIGYYIKSKAGWVFIMWMVIIAITTVMGIAAALV
jgi:hypothetical protein